MPNAETEAKIRDAAIRLFAHQGFASTTIRQVAEAAGVSAGLVIHYFGSKDELRAACDGTVARAIDEQKRAASSQGLSLDPMAAFKRANDGPPLGRYLARALAESSPGAAALFDQLVADAVGNMQIMIEQGMVRPSDDDYGRVVVLTTWSVGALVLHEHIERLLGVDLLSELGDHTASAAYLGPVIDILGSGILTPQVIEAFRQAFVDVDGKGAQDE